MPPCTLLFGATSILGYRIAKLFPDSGLAVCHPRQSSEIDSPMAGVEFGRSGVAGDGF